MTIAVLDKEKIAAEAGFITVYNYSAQTGEYTGSAEEYLAIGVGLPAFSTEIQPAVTKAGFVAVFNGSGWILREDYRGATVYSTADRSAVVVDYIGAIKDGYVTISPLTPYDKWDGEKWVTDTEAQRSAAVEAAEAQRQLLVDAAMASISLIQLKLQAGRKLTQAETTRLNVVLDYIDAVTAIDTSTAPDIDWPEQPE